MKLREIVRSSMMLMGLGVALLLASPIRAQQEMNPDTFDINPGTPKAEIAAATPVASPNAVQKSAVAQASVVPTSNWDGVFAAPLNAVDVAMVVILVLGTGLVALYTLTATRRQRRRLSTLRSDA